MSNSAKKRNNDAYYQANREEVLRKAKLRYEAKKALKHLTIVPEISNSPSARSATGKSRRKKARIEPKILFSVEQYLFEFQFTESFFHPFSKESVMHALKAIPNQPTEKSEHQKTEDASIEKTEKSKFLKSEKKWVKMKRGDIPALFRLILVFSISFLLMLMQIEFYRGHDIVPHYSVALGIAGEIAMVSLMLMKLGGWRDWLRKGIYGAFFLFMLGSLSFDVYSQYQTKALNLSAKSESSKERDSLQGQLAQAQESRKIAINNKASGDIKFYARESEDLRNKIVTIT